MKIKWRVLIFCLIVVYLIAFLGSLFSSKSVDTAWYESIKPSITPAGWVFPVVWNILFLLIAISLYFSWTNTNEKEKNYIGLAFGINLFLNFFWSFLFFGLQQVLGAFIELIVLWVSIWLMIFSTWKVNRKASYMLIPYLIWVSFAGVLNGLMAFG